MIKYTYYLIGYFVMDNYIIYEVSLLDETTNKTEIVYIGSGKPERALHPTSGKSSSRELNEAYFRNPSLMKVTIIREGLSKEESLEMEKSYIEASQPKFNIQHNYKRNKVNKFRRHLI